MHALTSRERRALEQARRRRARPATPLLRWRLRTGCVPPALLVAETAEAIRATVADHEVWSTRDEEEILARYVAAGVDVRSLEDVAAMVPLKIADEQAILRATPRGLFHQVRIRRRFHDRM